MAAAGAVPAADTAFAQAVPPAEAAPLDLARLIERGRAFVDQGDIVSARLLFDLAARRGSAEAARLMGETYDPLLSTGTPVGASKPDYQRAVTWYRRAVEMGDGDAKRRIGALIQHVERAAAQGDEDARQTLQTLR
jgi:TPR repeat protein